MLNFQTSLNFYKCAETFIKIDIFVAMLSIILKVLSDSPGNVIGAYIIIYYRQYGTATE